MTVWEQYSDEQRETYIEFIQMYGALSKMFNQKSSITGAPYLDSKFQETIYARAFDSADVDIGNTPHDIMSIFGNQRIGIGVKTWLNSSVSYQKVMQLKRYKSEIDSLNKPGKEEELANKISEIKNSKMQLDYDRLGLDENKNIYHYITRDKGKVVFQETIYPKIDISNLNKFSLSKSSFVFSDGIKQYKYTFGDSQIWMQFGNKKDQTLLKEVEINMLDDPFEFLKVAFQNKGMLLKDQAGVLTIKKTVQTQTDDVYLPLYSYRSDKVEEKSGLNAFNGAPKNKKNNSPRPEAEVYIPVPKEFHKKYPHWFSNEIDTRYYNKKAIPFTLHLPDGTSYPARLTQEGFKSFETNPQSALGKWLLYKILKLKPWQKVTIIKITSERIERKPNQKTLIGIFEQ